MDGITLGLFALATAIIGIFFHHCSGQLKNYEDELPKHVSYYFANTNQSIENIIKEIKRRLGCNIEKAERKKYDDLLNGYYIRIRDMFIVKSMFFVDIVLIIVYALYIFFQRV